MKYVLLPDSNETGVAPAGSRAQRNKRTQFLFGYSFIAQFLLMGFLTQQEAAKLPSR